MAEKLIELNSVETALEIFGSRDENIRLLENEFSITAVCRGSQIKFTGEPEQVAAAARAVDAMLTLLENHTPLEEQTVRYCISLAGAGEERQMIQNINRLGFEQAAECRILLPPFLSSLPHHHKAFSHGRQDLLTCRVLQHRSAAYSSPGQRMEVAQWCRP